MQQIIIKKALSKLRNVEYRLCYEAISYLPVPSIRRPQRVVKYLYYLIYYFMKQKYIFYRKFARDTMSCSPVTRRPAPAYYKRIVSV